MSRQLAGRRVLIVEDEYLIATLLESLLEELGCIVAGMASNPGDAIDLIKSTEIDAAVLDVNLGDVDSFGVAELLSDRGVPFIFATGYGRSRLPSGFSSSPVLQKPYRLDELGQALGNLTHDAPLLPGQR